MNRGDFRPFAAGQRRHLQACGNRGAANLRRTVELFAAANYIPIHPKPFVGVMG
jgi:hypothetical protein